MATATYPFSVPQLINICRQNDVSMIGIFGSMARGEAKKKSDACTFLKAKKFIGNGAAGTRTQRGFRPQSGFTH